MSSISVAGDTSGSITIAAPAVAGSGTLTLPTGTDTLIGKATTDTLTNKTLTSPVLTTPALGTPASGVLTNCTGVAAAALPAGSVLQVVQTVKTDVFTASTTTFVDITGLSVSITPRSASNKILVSVSVYSGSTQANEFYIKFNLVRDSTNIAVSTGAGAGQRNSTFATAFNSTGSAVYNFLSGSFTYLDSPATTSSVTYKLQASGVTSYPILVINRAGVNNANDYNSFASSTITVQEIQG